MPGYECQECVRLWREYGSTTTAHVRLDNKLRFAALQDDHPLIQSLTLELKALGAIRSAAREAIRRHDGTHFDRAAAAGT
jgi:hypothetical protein